MVFIPVENLADPRLNDYTNMTDVALRSKVEPERGLFMAESKNVIARAIETGHRPRSFLMAEKWLDSMTPLIEEATGFADGGNVPVFIADEETSSKLTGFRLHRGALAAMWRPSLKTVSETISGAHRIAILENLVDHTNVGAAFRSAAALNVDAILVTPSCADPYYRRSVRVSMGTVFQVPWTRWQAWPDPAEVKEAGFHVIAMALSNESVPLDELEHSQLVQDPNSKLAILLGTEGTGLTCKAIENADTVCRIPMGHGVDSLNVAAASAVSMWALRRRMK
ncbi:MAG: RNA methyltransferase [Winkia neuii]|uniref:RNA methyltransferase n=1 Tax=Winkia neuii TaxID=33007 RepID=A0A2I1ILG0_9ACTO|nr:RNA methyltransferase [Winkia neuii]OFJ70232.1 rRNA methyltransferase [Actinomyces sp. HMSC064C12]OFK04491.1 rRNA methyltransferase [Actinomyces sp. HMSC072A03]OFT56388.1 rRNA methyltransferase [Actinomyces sp. HMSC06A08]MDK8100349.1 RNA methyltransferase [Winkia neuii]MDU3134878.1 RNA methyltransferase [Winkia neuii]